MRTRYALNSLVLASLLAVAINNPAHAALRPWVAASTVTFDPYSWSNPGPVPAEFGGADYMWYCGDGIPTCPGNEGPTTAVFRYDFKLPVPQSRPYYAAFITLSADDYYALYVNGHLVGYQWLDDAIAANAADGDPSSPKFTVYDITADLLRDQSNQILIFACDAYPPGDKVSERISPGSTPAGGFDGCPSPQHRVNNYLLVGGGITEWEDSGAGPQIANYSLMGGELGSWQVSTVPEPATLMLVGLVLPTIGLLRRRQRPLGRRNCTAL